MSKRVACEYSQPSQVSAICSTGRRCAPGPGGRPGHHARVGHEAADEHGHGDRAGTLALVQRLRHCCSALHRAASCAASCGAARRTLCLQTQRVAFALALVQAAKQAETMASVGSLTLGVVSQLSLEWRRAHEQWQVRLVPRSRTARITVSA